MTPRTQRELVQAIRDEGYDVVQAGKHPKVLRPNGSFLMSLPGTPSEYRSVKNCWHQFLRLRLEPCPKR